MREMEGFYLLYWVTTASKNPDSKRSAIETKMCTEIQNKQKFSLIVLGSKENQKCFGNA